MKIRIGDYGNVDFDGAVEMNEQQKNDFIEFMETQFAVVEMTPSTDYRAERLGDKLFLREWTRGEIKMLLKIDNMQTTCRKLGRTYMSVNMMRGKYIPALTALAAREGLDLVKDSDILIKKYMDEQLQEIIVRREKRKQAKNELNTLKSDKKRLESKIRMHELQYSINQDVEIRDIIDKLKSELDFVKKKLVKIE